MGYNNSVRLQEDIAAIESALAQSFPEKDSAQNKLFEAMQYSLLAGGKRMRPVLLLEFCRACGGDVRKALPFACSLEMIHTYSLIHDDLPCMDNDDLRRGRPTNHKVYGEATALLAGDALLNAAFETAASAGTASPETALEALRILATASGALGMIGGQVLDLENEGSAPDIDRILLTDRLKTGALISAACEMGCILAGAEPRLRKAAVAFADALGLGFQIMDDLLNVLGDARRMGKPVASDAARGKMTYVEAYGIERTQALIEELTEKSKSALSVFPEPDFLLWYADWLAKRDT